jgi:hypothetical protein
MRTPKGFGKNYFTLAAIQATVSQIQLQSQCTAMTPSLHVNYDEESLCEDDPEETLLLSIIQDSTKASHCNCFYKAFSYQIIKNQSVQNCDIAQYLRTDSVSSPPIIFLTSQPKKIFKEPYV